MEDVVTLLFESSETLLSSPLVKIAGKDAVVTTVSSVVNSYSAAYTVVSGNTQGPVSVSIDGLDLAGNQEVHSGTTNTSQVVIGK